MYLVFIPRTTKIHMNRECWFCSHKSLKNRILKNCDDLDRMNIVMKLIIQFRFTSKGKQKRNSGIYSKVFDITEMWIKNYVEDKTSSNIRTNVLYFQCLLHSAFNDGMCVKITNSSLVVVSWINVTCCWE